MPLVGIQRRKQEMNDNFYIAVSARAALKDGKRKYFLGRLTCEKDRFFMSWKVQEKDNIQARGNEALRGDFKTSK